MNADGAGTAISLMLAVPGAPAAAAWYQRALDATHLWDFGSVVGLKVEGAPFFLAQPDNNGWDSPTVVGTTTVRVEVFVDDPDAFVERAVDSGAEAISDVQDHQMPWGKHRQGVFRDPFGHLWFVGDKSPLVATQIGRVGTGG